MQPYYQGTLNLRGLPLSNIDIPKRKIGMVFQDYCLFPTMNVFNNIAFGLKNQKLTKTVIRERVQNMAERLGINNLLSRQIAQLSGGEQQRVQLARVLAQLSPALEPSVIAKQGTPYLLIDEPTSSLDLYHQYHVMSLARAAADRGAGVIIVVHDLSLAASFADKLFVLKNGQVITSGKANDVLSSDILREVYNVDASLTLAPGQLPHLVISQHNECITQRR